MRRKSQNQGWGCISWILDGPVMTFKNRLKKGLQIYLF
jgi:hypothetical protein